MRLRGQQIVDMYLLTWAAGAMDALSYLRAGVFTANMTGNTVVLGLAIVGPGRSRVFHSLWAIAAFAAGALIGSMILVRRRTTDPTRELRLGIALELPFAVAFSFLWALFPVAGPYWIIPAMLGTAACALGIQSVAVRQLNISGVVTTFITGTITTAIVSWGERIERVPGPQNKDETSPLILAGMLVLYVVAAVAGGLLASAHSPLAPLVSIAALIAVFIRSSRAHGAPTGLDHT